LSNEPLATDYQQSYPRLDPDNGIINDELIMRLIHFLCLLSWIYTVLPGITLAQDPRGVEYTRPAYLLVVDKFEDTLYFINGETYAIEGRVEVGRGPHEVVAIPELNRAYVSNYEGDASISIIDLDRRREYLRSGLRRHGGAHGLAVSPNGSLLYITVEANLGVLEMDTKTGEPYRTLSTDQRITHMVAVSPDGGLLYTTNLGSGNVSVLDLATGEVLGHIATGNGTEGIALNSEGSQLWITNRGNDTVSIIDTHSLQIIDSIKVEGFPIRVAISPDGTRAVVSCAKTGDVKIIDASTREVLASIKTGEFPVGVEISPDGNRVFVANSGSGTVSVIDLQGLRVIRELDVGTAPDGMAFVPAR
jgi:YVTN family beta-propeller protein